MFLEIRDIKEYHPNGQLWISEQQADIAPIAYHLYDAAIIRPDGSRFIRTGTTSKFYDNGQLAWQLTYDNNGVVVRDNKPRYRKDGSVIEE